LTAPGALKSCLAGTTVQEVSESHPALRDAARDCFNSAATRLAAMLKEAAAARSKALESASLAALWMSAVQGSLILYKASRDESVIAATLNHVKNYINGLLA
jgi:hypothetical protein